ncbi:MAG: alkane 1-monooxygenase [Bacteroidota bacterium]
MRDLKYLLAYIPPLLAFLGLYFQGIWAFSTVVFTFGLIPVLELFTPNSQANFSEKDRAIRLSNRFFDILLYMNVPVVYGLVLYFLYILNTHILQTYEYIGLVLSVGIILGASGINVGHELGHRKSIFERFLAKLLLLPSMYVHFFIEHNRGHHKHVATPRDPASSRYNESLFFFWFRSVIFSYLGAWNIERGRLKRMKQSFWSVKNEMLVLQLVQLTYVVAIILLSATWLNAVLVFLAGIVGFLLLETVNYIEHYGLQRKKLPSGAYERVRPIHSWNSNHEVGRILLYELTRHSDHHYIASKKYQILDHHDQAPQLPFGYPAAMLAALVPPLWFKVMNRRVDEVRG